MFRIVNIILVVVFVFLYACKNTDTEGNYIDTAELKHLQINKYAQHFSCYNFDNFKFLVIENPWQNASNVKFSFVLANDKANVPDSLSGCVFIKTPVKRIICLSTTYIGFIDKLGETNTVIGVSGSKYVSNPSVAEGVKQGKVKDVGFNENLDYEEILMLKPDVIIAYGISSEVMKTIKKMKEIGIPVIVNAEFLESTPLGKAEWIRFFASLYDKETVADTFFHNVEQSYNKLKSLTGNISHRPRVLTGLPFKDVWYMPGGKTYMSNMIYDAGGDYVGKSDTAMDVVQLDIETVFTKAADAQVWINTGEANSIEDIAAVDKRLINFKAFGSGQVYNNNKFINSLGGNDYWESGAIQPHLVLEDLIRIFQPDILPEGQMVYYKKLK